MLSCFNHRYNGLGETKTIPHGPVGREDKIKQVEITEQFPNNKTQKSSAFIVDSVKSVII